MLEGTRGRARRPLALLAGALLLLAAPGCGEGDLGGGDGGPGPADAAGRDGDGPPRDADAADGGDGGGPDDGGPPGDGGPSDDAGGSGGDPSGGSGGAFPGEQQRETTDEGGTAFTYELYVPSSYDPSTAIPLLALFHGQGDSGANMRDFWEPTAESEGFMVLATSSTGSSGGWNPSVDVPRFSAALDDALAAYNVEQTRLYVWGFSAGAHVVHGVALANADTFAAYAVSAGALQSFAGTDAPSGAARTIPVDIHVGMEDPLFDFAQMDRDRFLAAGWTEGETLAFVAFDGGHTVLPAHRAAIWSFLAPWTL